MYVNEWLQCYDIEDQWCIKVIRSQKFQSVCVHDRLLGACGPRRCMGIRLDQKKTKSCMTARHLYGGFENHCKATFVWILKFGKELRYILTTAQMCQGNVVF